jgi:hypothetical protein
MSNITPEVLLGQSKKEYVKFLKSRDVDVFAEAGELLWESLKTYLKQSTKQTLDSAKVLSKVACQMGDETSELFFHCQHFHVWYTGEGVPNDFEAEKRLYSQSVKTLEKIINQKMKIVFIQA